MSLGKVSGGYISSGFMSLNQYQLHKKFGVGPGPQDGAGVSC